MVLPFHKSDYAKVPREDEVMTALRGYAIPPGDYMMPRASGMADMKSPAFKEKWKKGPVLSMTVMPSDHDFMGITLVQWFIYCLVVSVFSAYITSRALGPGAPY